MSRKKKDSEQEVQAVKEAYENQIKGLLEQAENRNTVIIEKNKELEDLRGRLEAFQSGSEITPKAFLNGLLMDAKAALLAEREAEVGPALFLELLLISLGRDRFHQRHRVVGLKHLGFEAAQPAGHAQDGRSADVQVDVGSIHANTGFQQAINVNSCHR